MPVKEPESQRRSSKGSPRSSHETQAQISPQAAPSPSSWNVDRGRSRVRRPSGSVPQDDLERKGYHALHSSFGKVFHVKKRWKLVREMGSGAYGHVISAADEISGETVAIKLVSRVFDKAQLAKRALREVTLLRHFSGHGSITGLIDVEMASRDSNEIYIFMEPMEADLHQIIKSGQTLTTEHVQYFIYQVLCGMKYVHSASVIHRDLKPGNILVNADCELKICDFGLSRGFDSTPDENATHLTEYVATRWYRAPEIMLGFRQYNTAIDVWSIGCILAELLMGQPLFKGKDYVDQLKKILDVLGTPDEGVLRRICSDKAQAYVRSLPIKKRIPFRKILPAADLEALDLLTRMLAFDPSARITVPEALEHPWLRGYHDIADEPGCEEKFDRWRDLEKLETIDEFRDALWNEIRDYRREVRGGVDEEEDEEDVLDSEQTHPSVFEPDGIVQESESLETSHEEVIAKEEPDVEQQQQHPQEENLAPQPPGTQHPPTTPTDPVVSYARRSSIMQHPARQTSTPIPMSQQPSFTDSPLVADPASMGQGTIAFPTTQSGFVVPSRSRTGSTAGREVTRRLLRTLSTVSIHESLTGGGGDLAAIGRFIVQDHISGADAPPSEVPRNFGIDETSEGEEDEDGSEKPEDKRTKDVSTSSK